MSNDHRAIAHVKHKAHQQARRGRPWLDAEDVVSYDGQGGPIAHIVDENDLPLGTALYCPNEDIRVRLFSSARTRDPLALFRTRFERAQLRRKKDLLGADGYRLSHAEADGLPRIFVDRYGDGLFCATACEAADVLFPDLVESLIDVTGAKRLVHWKRGSDGQTFEPTRLVGEHARVRFHNGRLLMGLDLEASFALFGLSARLAAQRQLRRFARGRVLDVDARDGGFALQLCDAGATQATAIESNPRLVARILDDAEENGLTDRMQIENDDGNERMRQLHARGERFDMLVLHPDPAAPFRDLEQAQQSTFERHQRAFRLLDEGRLLITWPTAPMSFTAFRETVAEAAARTQRQIQVLARFDAGPDHPGLLAAPESRPAPTWVCRVLSTS